MRIALGVEYSGERYCGWQRQKHSPSVQQEVEQALSKVADEELSVFCAGRTDTGVHATGQVIHFDTQAVRPDKAWLLGANHHLPAGIAIQWVKPVTERFHARFSATARRYRFIILNRKARPAVLSGGVDWYYGDLDVALMNQAGQSFLGEQDFSSVRAAGCQSNTPMRNIHFLRVTRFLDYVVVDIEANAFLLHMVRNIVGVLKSIGSGQNDVAWASELLSAKNRCLAPATAPAKGLYLVDVTYPKCFDLPKHHIGPLFLTDNL